MPPVPSPEPEGLYEWYMLAIKINPPQKKPNKNKTTGP